MLDDYFSSSFFPPFWVKAIFDQLRKLLLKAKTGRTMITQVQSDVGQAYKQIVLNTQILHVEKLHLVDEHRISKQEVAYQKWKKQRRDHRINNPNQHTQRDKRDNSIIR